MYQIEHVTKDGKIETMYVSGDRHNTVYAKSPQEMLAKTDSFREESLTVNGACSLWLKKQDMMTNLLLVLHYTIDGDQSVTDILHGVLF